MRLTILALIVSLSILSFTAVAAPKPTQPDTPVATPAAAKPATFQQKITVVFPEKGAYVFWFEYKDTLGDKQVAAPKHVSGEDAEISLEPVTLNGKLADGELKIYDTNSGNVASKKLKNLEGKTDLDLKDKDFDLVQTVRIVLKPTDGKPGERVESALVTLTDANSDEFTAFVDPSSEGVAEFHGIAAGAVSVVVSYEGDKKMTQDNIDIPLDRDTPVFTEELALSSKVHTIKVSGTAQADGSSKEAGKTSGKKEKPEAAVSWVQYIMSIFLLFMIGVVAFVVLKAKGATFGGTLQKMGVQLPNDDASNLNIPAPALNEPQVDPNVCQFCGQRKDANGNCACSISGPLGGSPAPSGTAGIPRLVGSQGQYSGHIFEITGNEASIGRDTGNTIPLPEDNTSSRRHSKIVKENGAFTIVDEGSSNGTFVNGMKITGRHPLQSGDEVQIGGTKFRFEQ